MRKALLSAVLLLSPAVLAGEETVYLHYDDQLDGAMDYQHHVRLNVSLSGNTIIGKTETGAVISGQVENKNSYYIGSGEQERFSFEIHNGDTRNWYFGRVAGNYWEGVWYGPDGEKGDFSLHTNVLNDGVPQYQDVLAFYTDEVFERQGSELNHLNPGFLMDLGGLDLHFTNDHVNGFELDLSQGLYARATAQWHQDMPMSIYLDFKQPMRMKTFRLGSANLDNGVQLKAFSFSIWDREAGAWQVVGNFEFPDMPGPAYQRQEFVLPRTVYSDRIRIAAQSSADTGAYGYGQVLMWGLSFQR
ncbi:hypothetical protein [Shewanella sp. GXUN23E]|uniref:hypothetical protein n=1 Tax=Shewanella sp. GXUN23E TaxID=3422498 RepID=UPI003D7E12DD